MYVFIEAVLEHSSHIANYNYLRRIRGLSLRIRSETQCLTGIIN